MLGDQVYEIQGKNVGMRVLPDGKIERTVIDQGMFLGEEFSCTYTMVMEIRPDGTGFMEFHGFYTTKGGVMGKYKGMGNGMSREDGTSIMRGSVCFFSPPGKYARLNGIAVVWEAETDKEGIIHGKGWEWK
jgi:hypothetical protein